MAVIPDFAGSRPRFRAALMELAQLDKSDLDGALRKILATDADMLDVARVSFWELSADHAAIHSRTLFVREGAVFVDGGELRAASFPAYFEALLESRTIVADDAWTDPRTNEFVDSYFRPLGIGAMLDVPVWRRGRLAGVVCHEHIGGARAWSIEEQDFALGIGNLVSVALEAVDRRRAEEGYALVGRASSDVLWDWDITRDVIDWSEALAQVFRHPPMAVLASSTWWAAQVHPDDRPRVQASLADALAGTATSWADQYRWLRGDGSIAMVSDRGYIVRDERGRAVRMVGSVTDDSERLALEARLTLSDRLASLGTLAAGVAHEINNPLTYVQANLAGALEELGGGLADVPLLRELLREALEGAERVRGIVRDLQVFARPREDEVGELDILPVLESSINMAWNQIRHRAQLVRDLAPVPRVRINRARLGQVILNLLVNAAHAVPEGASADHTITVRTRIGAASEVILEIHDTGPGLPPEVQARVFEPFFTTKPIGLGTGLGLSICHSIITEAGGRIEILSPPGAGCTVRVVLAGVPGEIAAVRAPAVAPGLVRRRVLLVDDEAQIRRALQRVLGAHHEILLAESSESALELVRSGAAIDVVLCDLMMPRMTGMELHERLREEAPVLAARTIFITGGAFSERTAAFIADCPQPVLEKPVDRQTLLSAIAAISG